MLLQCKINNMREKVERIGWDVRGEALWVERLADFEGKRVEECDGCVVR